MRAALFLLVGLAVVPPQVGVAQAQTTDIAVTRRIAAMSAVALEEYALGVENGRIVSRAELDEAESFLQEARRRSSELTPAVGSVTVAMLDSLLAGVAARRPVGDLQRRLDSYRRTMERTLGASLDPLPAAAPSLARAQRVYQLRCAECHGTAGGGDGPKAAGMDPPPVNFTARTALRSTNPLDFFRKISVGVSGTEMREWESLISLEDRWSLALYVSGLRYSDAERHRGDSLVRAVCPGCLTELSDLAASASRSDDSLAAMLAAGAGQPIDSSALESAVAFARTAPAAEVLGGDRTVQLERVIQQTTAGLNEAEALAGRGEREQAASRALDAYLVFERIEADLRARNGGIAARAEQAFGDFRARLAAGSPAEIREAKAAVDRSLEGARVAFGRESGPGVLLGQSFLIMVREGLEAILIIGALIAIVVKAGAPERKRDIGWGVGAALGASLVTAAVLATLFRNSIAQQEMLEGILMLVAAGVLFWVSYWLVSKIEIKKWHAFVSTQVQRALTSGGAVALASVAFLAVYREGFETVLFYSALFASGDGTATASASILGGIVLGGGVLGVIYYAIQRWGVRIPLKPFFAVTSALLYLMAFSFAGQGIAELQEAGVISATPLRWVPSVPALGIFPTAQTLAIQLFLSVAVLGALVWVFWLEPKVAEAR